MTNNTTNIKQIRGVAYWAQILGNPVPNYNKDGFEWSIDVSLDVDTVATLKKLGLGQKIKNKGDDRGDFITFRRAAIKKAGPKAGEPNNNIRVVGPDGKTEWDHSVRIGNGSVVNVRFSINENKDPKGRKTIRADILSLQVWEHHPYVPPEGKELPAEYSSNTEAHPNQSPSEGW